MRRSNSIRYMIFSLVDLHFLNGYNQKSFFSQALWNHAASLAKLLSIFASGCRAREYVDYYYNEFPEFCPRTVSGI